MSFFKSRPEDEVPLAPKEKTIVGTNLERKDIIRICIGIFFVGYLFLNLAINFLEMLIVYVGTSLKHGKLPSNISNGFSSLLNPINWIWNWNYMGGTGSGIFIMVQLVLLLCLIGFASAVYYPLFNKYGSLNNQEYGAARIASYKEVEESTNIVPDRNEPFDGLAGAIMAHRMNDYGKANMLVKLEKRDYGKILGLNKIKDEELLKAAKKLVIVVSCFAGGILLIDFLTLLLLGFFAWTVLTLLIILGLFIFYRISLRKSENTKKKIADLKKKGVIDENTEQ